MKYIPTIGLEIHAELKTHSKMFCSCKNDTEESKANTNICPVCMGHPGTLPVPNKEAVRLTQKAGLALGCQLAEYSKFDRKNYFYPDLPKGYQISQYDLPFCANGYLDIAGSEVNPKRVHIRRVHLEEDTGKLVHPAKTEYSLVDFNRAGVPLMELVTEPDIETGEEAKAFAQELQMILRYINASDADMEKGHMRVEANISVRPEGTEKLGTKVEVKNLNSFRAVEKAIAFEIARQTESLEKGAPVTQETRGWNDEQGVTFSQREKEEAHEYRYFPEPDIPPFRFEKTYIEALRAELPELPQERRARFAREYGLSKTQAEIFAQYKELGDYYEHVIGELGSKLNRVSLEAQTKLAANYILTDFMALLEDTSLSHEEYPITPENFAELVNLLYEGKLSSPAAKQILKEMYATKGDPSQIMETKGLTKISDQKDIESIAKEIIEKNPKAAKDYAKGKQNSLQFLIGQMMAKTKGTVSPETAADALRKLLASG